MAFNPKSQTAKRVEGGNELAKSPFFESEALKDRLCLLIGTQKLGAADDLHARFLHGANVPGTTKTRNGQKQTGMEVIHTGKLQIGTMLVLSREWVSSSYNSRPFQNRTDKLQVNLHLAISPPGFFAESWQPPGHGSRITLPLRAEIPAEPRLLVQNRPQMKARHDKRRNYAGTTPGQAKKAKRASSSNIAADVKY